MASTAKAKAKTSLACDRCRQRKSRCDGIRPRCTHCTNAGVECLYRPTPTSLETDVSLLSRLADAEARIQALENQSRDEGFPSARAHTRRDGPDGDFEVALAPTFHTASAHQMIHSWPRVRLCLSSHGNPLSFLADADGREPPFADSHRDSYYGTPDSASHASPLLRTWQAAHILASFHDNYENLPLLLTTLLDAYDGFNLGSVLGYLDSRSHMSTIHPEEFSLQHAIVLCLALASQAIPELPDQLATAAVYFKSVLDRQWMLWNTVHERIAISVAIAYCLLYGWARPFHALGALQSAAPSLKRVALRVKNDPRLAIFASLYYVIESDILNEVDEYSSDTILSTDADKIVDILSSKPSAAVNSPDTSLPDANVGFPKSSHMDGVLWLRSQMNKILSLYTPLRAYARPHELADVVFRLGTELRQWYQSLAPEKQFPRDIVAFTMHGSSLRLDMAQRELALRYFACILFLHRPVLYFFLHKDMEYAIQPPMASLAASDHSPWVLESCRDCIESVVLIIQLCKLPAGEETYGAPQYWPEYQLLFAAYLILLQVRTRPALEPCLKMVGDVERLLDLVEEVFRAKVYKGPLIKESLVLLVDARSKLDDSSPSHIDSAH